MFIANALLGSSMAAGPEEIGVEVGSRRIMLLINVDERAPKIRPRSHTNVDEIGSQSDPSPVFCVDGRGRR